MKLMVNGKSIVKKMKILKFLAEPMLYTSKESLEHLEIRFRLKKYDFLKKKSI